MRRAALASNRRELMTAPDPTTINRLYGRSTGHKLRVEQAALVETLLPQISGVGSYFRMRLTELSRPVEPSTP